MKKVTFFVLILFLFVFSLGDSTVEATIQSYDNLSDKTKEILTSKDTKDKEHIFLVEIAIEEDKKELIEEKREYFASSTSGITDLSSAYRESVRDVYSAEFNKQYLSFYKSFNVLYISKYTPYMIIKGNLKDALSLASKETTKMIEVMPESYDIVTFDNEEVSSSEVYDDGFDYHYEQPYLTSTNIPAFKVKYLNITGADVDIGIYDSGVVDVTNPQLSGKVSKVEQDDEIDTNHATTIAIIAAGKDIDVGVAHNAYIVSIGIPPGDLTDIIINFELLIDYGVDVVNICWGVRAMDDYDYFSSWVDALITNTGVTIVASAGNNGEIDQRVATPARAHHVISVGATNPGGTFVSSYSSYDSIFPMKPTVVAPGGYETEDTRYGLQVPDSPYQYGTIVGTSFSAPQVTGMVALLMQMDPVLKLYPHIVRAALIAGSSNANLTNVTADTFDVSNKAGAGLPDMIKVAQAISKMNFFGYYNTSTTPSSIITSTSVILIAGEKITIGHTFIARNAPSQQQVRSNYSVEIYKDGVILTSTLLLNSYTEKLVYVVPSGGAYTIRVKLISKTGSYQDQGIVVIWTSTNRQLIGSASHC